MTPWKLWPFSFQSKNKATATNERTESGKELRIDYMQSTFTHFVWQMELLLTFRHLTWDQIIKYHCFHAVYVYISAKCQLFSFSSMIIIISDQSQRAAEERKKKKNITVFLFSALQYIRGNVYFVLYIYLTATVTLQIKFWQNMWLWLWDSLNYPAL